MSEILFASNNKGKIAEAKLHASSVGVHVLGCADLARLGPAPEVEENADSYLGNARLKADAFFSWSGVPSVGDDSGLEVAALAGAPGLYSARYAGTNATSQANIAKLLDALKSAQDLQQAGDRSARFVAVLVLALGHDRYLEATGVLEGEIALEPRGLGGFGYDPVFIVSGYGKTLAELKEQGTAVATHRTLALDDLFKKIQQANLGLGSFAK